MEITFVKTSQSNLNNVPVEPGQFIFTDDSKQLYMDFDQERKGVACQDEVDVMIDVNGCCNILDNNQPNETTNDITWTVNADKTITASSSGQSVSGLEHHVINYSYTLQPGTYKLSGGVDSNNYIELLETNYDYTGIIDTGNGYEFTVSAAHTYIVLLRSGNSVVNAEFKPMIYDARLNPTGYVRYSMTNEQLTERVVRQIYQVQTVEIAPLGYDNSLCQNVIPPQVQNISYYLS